MAVPIGKLLGLPVINLFDLCIALDYHQFMLLRTVLFTVHVVKGIRVSQDSDDTNVILSINVEDCMTQLKIMDFDNKQKTFGFKS